MLMQGYPGPAGSGTLAANTLTALRQDQQGGGLMVSQLHGKDYEHAYRKMLFTAANQTAQAVTVQYSTAYTGLCLSNPIGSTVNLVVQKVGIALSTGPAAVDPIGIMAGYNSSTAVVHSTTLTTRSMFWNMATNPSVGNVDSTCTLPTAPVLVTPLISGFTATALFGMGPLLFDFEGALILPPGGYAAIFGFGAFSGFFSIFWEETPQ